MVFLGDEVLGCGLWLFLPSAQLTLLLSFSLGSLELGPRGSPGTPAAGTVGIAGLPDTTMALGTLQEAQAFLSHSLIPLKHRSRQCGRSQNETKALF